MVEKMLGTAHPTTQSVQGNLELSLKEMKDDFRGES